MVVLGFVLWGPKRVATRGIAACPIRTARNDHSWHQQAFDNFPAAAYALTLGEVLKPPKQENLDKKVEGSMQKLSLSKGSEVRGLC